MLIYKSGKNTYSTVPHPYPDTLRELKDIYYPECNEEDFKLWFSDEFASSFNTYSHFGEYIMPGDPAVRNYIKFWLEFECGITADEEALKKIADSIQL